VSRLGVGGPPGRPGTDARPRFIVPDEDLIQAHFAFRDSVADAPAAVASFTRGAGERDTLFSACRSTEVAWESHGQGDFTRVATQLLARGVAGVTQGAFLAQVHAALGSNPRQHPEVHPTGAGALMLLAPEPGRAAEAAAPGLPLEPAAFAGGAQDVAALLRSIAAVLTAR
jgi:hypothetical protein